MLLNCESERVFAWIIWLSLDCVDTNWSFITTTISFSAIRKEKTLTVNTEYYKESSRVYSFIYITVQ